MSLTPFARQTCFEGQDPKNIVRGNTLSADGSPKKSLITGRKFSLWCRLE